MKGNELNLFYLEAYFFGGFDLAAIARYEQACIPGDGGRDVAPASGR